MNKEQKMKVDIWSDIMCPFCYIGKRKFEKALAQFEHKDDVEIIWHSFQLDPGIEYAPDRNLYDYLAERKGQSRDWSVKVHGQMTETAKQVGLEYNFDKAVVANSFDAHRLIQMAKQEGKGDAAEEQLFKAYFTDGKNMSEPEVLAQIGAEIGMDAGAVRQMLQSEAYKEEVGHDITAAEALGINGVPFFVLDNKYGVSGAQAPETFLGALAQAWTEGRPAMTTLGDADSAACGPDGCTI